MPGAGIISRPCLSLLKPTFSISPFLPSGKAGEYPDLKNEKAPAKYEAFSKLTWRPQGDSNPCCRRERPVSLAGLDDGDTPHLDTEYRVWS
jgi:hypothetical protein